MIVDLPDFDGDGDPDRRLLRYPGALLSKSGTPTGFTVGIPLVTSANEIRWVPVIEEIDTEENPDDNTGDNPDPFQLSSRQRGLVALRINYPYQSPVMSGFRPNPAGPFEPTIGQPIVADDGMQEENASSRPGDLIDEPLLSGNRYAGTYGGQYGLGAQGAMGSQELTGGLPVRPFRRVISAQAIYRREVFAP
jgi:hypothetical protein